MFSVAQWDMQARLMRISDDARANGQVLDQPVCEWAFSREVDADPRVGDLPQYWVYIISCVPPSKAKRVCAASRRSAGPRISGGK